MIWILYTLRRFGLWLGKVAIAAVGFALMLAMLSLDWCAGLIGGP